MRVVISPQQNFLECGCPRARGPAVDDVGPRDAGANEIVLSRRGQGQAPHATRPAGPGRGAATAPANRMIMDICWYRGLPCACHPIRRFWLYVAASTASKHGRRLQHALVTHGDACSSRTVLRKVLRRIVRPFAVRRPSRSVHHGHAAAAARRARGRPRRVAVGPRPSRPELSVRTPPGAPAHRAPRGRRPPARTVGSAVEARACARPTTYERDVDAGYVLIENQRRGLSAFRGTPGHGEREPPPTEKVHVLNCNLKLRRLRKSLRALVGRC